MEEEIGEIQEHPVLVVTEEMRSYMYDMAKWAGFLAVVGFVFSGIAIIGAFTIGPAIEKDPNTARAFGDLGALSSIVITVVYLVYAFILFYPSLLMFKYSSKAKYGILYGEQSSLDEAFAKLKSLFKFWGIITIVFLGLFIVTLISMVMGRIAT